MEQNNSTDKIPWKSYEDAIYEECKRIYQGWIILKDVYLHERYSNKKRQIDVLVYKDEQHKDETSIIFDGNYYKRKIDVKGVECFLGMMGDLEIKRGVLVTDVRYSKTSLNRAQRGIEDLEADILSLQELSTYQNLWQSPIQVIVQLLLSHHSDGLLMVKRMILPLLYCILEVLKHCKMIHILLCIFNFSKKMELYKQLKT